jgi:hypothetical protein
LATISALIASTALSRRLDTALTTTTIRGAAKNMTARHYRHPPVPGGTGFLGVAHITDMCLALISAGEG